MKSSSDSADTSALPESLRLLSLLWSLDAALGRTSSAMDAAIGVTGPQRFLPRFVGLEPGVTPEKLASVVLLNAADLQADLHQLVDKNLLTAPSESTGYFLTGRGASVNAVVSGTVEQAISRAIDEALPYERTSFRRMLERVLQHLESQR